MINFEKLAERKIQEAIKRGEFDNLSGAGKKIDLTTYFQAPEHLRIGYKLLKDAGYLPEEIELKKEIEELENKRNLAIGEQEKAELESEINYITMKFNLLLEQYRRSS